MKYKWIFVGTRPETIKMWPFTKYDDFKFVWINQSKDLKQDLINFDYEIEEKDLESFIVEHAKEMSVVLCQGDTRSAFFTALYAFYNKVPVAHVEAGLRTYDLTQPFPEEAHRQMIDRIATYRFCSTYSAYIHLTGREGFRKGNYVPGQTSIDTLFEFLPKDVEQEDFYIVTVHRNESWARIQELIGVLKAEKNYFKKDLHIYAHPNRVGQELRKHFDCLDPLPYREFVKEMAKCKGFISDSGGLQEEAIALGKEFISLREKSERGHGETYAPGATAKIVEVLNG